MANKRRKSFRRTMAVALSVAMAASATPASVIPAQASTAQESGQGGTQQAGNGSMSGSLGEVSEPLANADPTVISEIRVTGLDVLRYGEDYDLDANVAYKAGGVDQAYDFDGDAKKITYESKGSNIYVATLTVPLGNAAGGYALGDSTVVFDTSIHQLSGDYADYPKAEIDGTNLVIKVAFDVSVSTVSVKFDSGKGTEPANQQVDRIVAEDATIDELPDGDVLFTPAAGWKFKGWLLNDGPYDLSGQGGKLKPTDVLKAEWVQEIDAVTLTGVEALTPTVGEELPNESGITYTYSSAGSDVDNENVLVTAKWKEIDSENTFADPAAEDGGKANFNTKYGLEITLAPQGGFVFPESTDDLTVTIGSDINYRKIIDKTHGTIKIQYYGFEKTRKAQVTKTEFAAQDSDWVMPTYVDADRMKDILEGEDTEAGKKTDDYTPKTDDDVKTNYIVVTVEKLDGTESINVPINWTVPSEGSFDNTPGAVQNCGWVVDTDSDEYKNNFAVGKTYDWPLGNDKKSSGDKSVTNGATQLKNFSGLAIANYPTAAGQDFAASGNAAIYTVVYKADGTVDTPSALTPDDTVKITDVKLNGATVTDWSEDATKAGSNKVYTVEVTVKVPKTTTLPLDAENKVPTDKITLSDAMVAAGCTVTGVTAVEADGDDNKFVISVQMPATGAAGYLTGLDTDGDTATRLNPNTENTIALKTDAGEDPSNYAAAAVTYDTEEHARGFFTSWLLEGGTAISYNAQKSSSDTTGIGDLENVGIEWTFEPTEGNATYNPAPGATNYFRWTVTDAGLEAMSDYDYVKTGDDAVPTTGTVKLTNERLKLFEDDGQTLHAATIALRDPQAATYAYDASKEPEANRTFPLDFEGGPQSIVTLKDYKGIPYTGDAIKGMFTFDVVNNTTPTAAGTGITFDNTNKTVTVEEPGTYYLRIGTVANLDQYQAVEIPENYTGKALGVQTLTVSRGKYSDDPLVTKATIAEEKQEKPWKSGGYTKADLNGIIDVVSDAYTSADVKDENDNYATVATGGLDVYYLQTVDANGDTIAAADPNTLPTVHADGTEDELNKWTKVDGSNKPTGRGTYALAVVLPQTKWRNAKVLRVSNDFEIGKTQILTIAPEMTVAALTPTQKFNPDGTAKADGVMLKGIGNASPTVTTTVSTVNDTAGGSDVANLSYEWKAYGNTVTYGAEDTQEIQYNTDYDLVVTITPDSSDAAFASTITATDDANKNSKNPKGYKNIDLNAVEGAAFEDANQPLTLQNATVTDGNLELTFSMHTVNAAVLGVDWSGVADQALAKACQTDTDAVKLLEKQAANKTVDVITQDAKVPVSLNWAYDNEGHEGAVYNNAPGETNKFTATMDADDIEGSLEGYTLDALEDNGGALKHKTVTVTNKAAEYNVTKVTLANIPTPAPMAAETDEAKVTGTIAVTVDGKKTSSTQTDSKNDQIASITWENGETTGNVWADKVHTYTATVIVDAAAADFDAQEFVATKCANWEDKDADAQKALVDVSLAAASADNGVISVTDVKKMGNAIVLTLQYNAASYEITYGKGSDDAVWGTSGQPDAQYIEKGSETTDQTFATAADDLFNKGYSYGGWKSANTTEKVYESGAAIDLAVVKDDIAAIEAQRESAGEPSITNAEKVTTYELNAKWSKESAFGKATVARVADAVYSEDGYDFTDKFVMSEGYGEETGKKFTYAVYVNPAADPDHPETYNKEDVTEVVEGCGNITVNDEGKLIFPVPKAGEYIIRATAAATDNYLEETADLVLTVGKAVKATPDVVYGESVTVDPATRNATVTITNWATLAEDPDNGNLKISWSEDGSSFTEAEVTPGEPDQETGKIETATFVIPAVTKSTYKVRAQYVLADHPKYLSSAPDATDPVAAVKDVAVASAAIDTVEYPTVINLDYDEFRDKANVLDVVKAALTDTDKIDTGKPLAVKAGDTTLKGKGDNPDYTYAVALNADYNENKDDTFTVNVAISGVEASGYVWADPADSTIATITVNLVKPTPEVSVAEGKSLTIPYTEELGTAGLNLDELFTFTPALEDGTEGRATQTVTYKVKTPGTSGSKVATSPLQITKAGTYSLIITVSEGTQVLGTTDVQSFEIEAADGEASLKVPSASEMEQNPFYTGSGLAQDLETRVEAESTTNLKDSEGKEIKPKFYWKKVGSTGEATTDVPTEAGEWEVYATFAATDVYKEVTTEKATITILSSDLAITVKDEAKTKKHGTDSINDTTEQGVFDAAAVFAMPDGKDVQAADISYKLLEENPDTHELTAVDTIAADGVSINSATGAVTYTKAGEYKVRVIVAPNEEKGYATGGSMDATITVEPGDGVATLTASGETLYLGTGFADALKAALTPGTTTNLKDAAGEDIVPTIYYKDASDAGATPTTDIPTAEGTYSVYAVYAANGLYGEASSAEAPATITVASKELDVKVKADATLTKVHGSDTEHDTVEGGTFDAAAVFDVPEKVAAGDVSYVLLKTGTGTVTEETSVDGASIAGGTLSYTKAGTYKVRVKVAANTAYDAAQADAEITVSKGTGSATVTMPNALVAPVTTAYEPTVESTTNASKVAAKTVKYKAKNAGDADYTTDCPTKKGDYTVQVTIPATDLYNEVVKTADFSIAEKVLADWTITTNPKTVTYAGDTIDIADMFVLPTQASAGEKTYSLVDANGATIDGTTVTVTKAGTFTVKLAVAADADYKAEEATATLTVNKGKVSISVTQGDVEEGTTVSPVVTVEPTMDYTVKYQKSGESTWSEKVPTAPGSYTVKAEVAGNDLYEGKSETATFTISEAAPTEADLEITAPTTPIEATYDGSTIDVGAQFGFPKDYTGKKTWSITSTNGGAATIEDGVVTVTKAGTFTVGVSGAKQDGKYKAGSAEATLTVAKGEGKATINVGTQVAGTDYTPEITSTTNDAAQAVVTYRAKGGEWTSEQPKAEGSYEVKAVLSATDLYTEATATGSFQITAAAEEITVIGTDKTVVYDGSAIDAASMFTITTGAGVVKYTFDGSVPAENAQIDAESGSVTVFKAGSFVVRATAEGGATNTAVLTVNKGIGKATITVEGFKEGSGEAHPVVESSTNAGAPVTISYKLKDAEDATFTSGAPEAAGEYVAKVVYAATDLYEAAEDTAEFTISRETGSNSYISGGGNVTPAPAADGKTDDGKKDDGKTDDGKTDDGKTDDGKTDDGKTDDGTTSDDGSGESTETFEDVAEIMTAYVSASSTDAQALTWSKVNGAAGYKVYVTEVAEDGKEGKWTLIGTTKSKTHIVNRNLKKGTFYKYQVRPFEIVDGEEQVLGRSIILTSTTAGGQYGNATKVTVENKKESRKVGKTFKIKAKAKEKNKPLETEKLTYKTTNSKVARVNKNGKVRIMGKGTCFIYVYAQNGRYTKVMVTGK